MKLLKKIFFTSSIVFASALLPAVHAAIFIGQTAAMTGPTGAAMKEINEGANLYFGEINRKGGVKGEQIVLLTMDDKFDAATAVLNAKALINEKSVLALFLSRGTSQTEALLPLLAEHDVALVAPSTGAMSLHQPVNRHVFNVRTSYQKEAAKAVLQMTSVGMSRVAVIYRDDGFGRDGLAGALNGLKAARLEPVFLMAVDKTKADFTAAISKAKELGPQAIMVVEAPATSARAVNELRAAGVKSQVTVLSNCASFGFVKSLGDNARGVVVSQVFPGERSFGVPLISEINNLAKGKGIEISPATIEGYTAAKVLTQALMISAHPISRKSLRVALESMQNYDLGGLLLSFSPDDHSGLRYTDLSIIGKDGKFNR